MYQIGRNKLFEFLRRCKVLTKQSNYNITYGRFTNNGMLRVITSGQRMDIFPVPRWYPSNIAILAPFFVALI
ncbi:phage antirepressor KilAC domain-containing protein [Lacrimispora sp.]|uniref:phage antirepressor KilAC domain-containing protein n=1 Tax=Lacrimispora sp. TaxID=2719234 RepID=UPI003FA5EA9A